MRSRKTFFFFFSEPGNSLTLALGLLVTLGAPRVSSSFFTRVPGWTQIPTDLELGSRTSASLLPLAYPG